MRSWPPVEVCVSSERPCAEGKAYLLDDRRRRDLPLPLGHDLLGSLDVFVGQPFALEKVSSLLACLLAQAELLAGRLEKVDGEVEQL